MKKALSLVLVVVMLAAFGLSASASYAKPALTDEYVFGNGTERTTQGVDGFYFMYSDEFNKAGVYDVSKFENAVWSDDNTWSAWGPYFTWQPTPESGYVAPDEDDNRYFAIDKDGRVKPNSDKTALIKWVAPCDGKFEFNVNFEGGTSFPNWWLDWFTYTDEDGGDGLYYSVYKNSDKLFGADACVPFADRDDDGEPNGFISDNEFDGIFDSALELKAGDAIYFIADQNLDPDYDESYWNISVKPVDVDLSSVIPEGFKQVASFGSAAQEAQGTNGVYFQYSDEFNKGAVLDTTKFKDSVWSKDNSWSAWGWDTYTWQPPVSEISADYYDPDAWVHGFYYTCDPATGKVVPSAEKSAVIKYVAPEDGEYFFVASFKGGSSLPVGEGWWWDDPEEYAKDPEIDGVSYSIFKNADKLFSANANLAEKNHEAAENFVFDSTFGDAFKNAISMKKGDVIYFVTDGNAESAYDAAFWNVKVFNDSGKEEETTGTTEPTTKPTDIDDVYEEMLAIYNGLPKLADGKVDVANLTDDQKAKVAEFIKMMDVLTADQKADFFNLAGISEADVTALRDVVSSATTTSSTSTTSPPTGAGLPLVVFAIGAVSVVAVCTSKKKSK